MSAPTTAAHEIALAALAARLDPGELRAVIAELEPHPRQHAPGWENYEEVAGLVLLSLNRRW
ncbi:MAG: hypothetical protein JWO74_1343 [Solirubrobacterales bacterium]|jgi:hypothetical protein|nr:hypothetical protein [Solirubrobacterales bacterium]